MPDEKEPMGGAELPAIRIIQQIKEGLIDDPEKLPKEMRQACVECLLSQFWSISKIAAFLKRDDRTIKRDKKEIELRNSEKPSIDYSLRLIAELTQKANTVQERLMLLASDETGSVQEKGQAAFYAWKVIEEGAKLMQRLGYLPEQPMKIDAVITQDAGKDITKLKEELVEAEKIINERGKNDDPVISGLIKSIKKEIAIAEANSDIDQLRKLITEPEKDSGTPNEPRPNGQ